jgi:hypothetical protein
MRLGSLAGGVAGGMIAEGVRQFTCGERLSPADMMLTPANARRVAEQLARLRGASWLVCTCWPPGRVRAWMQDPSWKGISRAGERFRTATLAPGDVLQDFDYRRCAARTNTFCPKSAVDLDAILHQPHQCRHRRRLRGARPSLSAGDIFDIL